MNRSSQFFNNFGFTLLELLIVVAVLAVLGFMGFSYLGSYQKNLNLDKDARQITGYLELARSRSIAQENNKAWGVHFENPGSGSDFFEIYSTSSDYAGGTVSEKIYLSSEVYFSDPSSGNTEDIQFGKLSGNISATASIIIFSQAVNENQEISVNKKGAIAKTASQVKVLGQGCNTGVECFSSYCVNGVCCDASSCDTCKACNVSGVLGTCSNVISGQEGNNCTLACQECNGSGSCVSIADHSEDNTGSNKCEIACQECNGLGSCVNIANNTQDTAGTYTCNSVCHICDGSGACEAKTVDGSSATALGCASGEEACRRCDAGSCTYYADKVQHSCSSDYACFGAGVCTYKIVIVSTNGGSNCNTLCAAQDGRSCLDTGTDAAATNNYTYRRPWDICGSDILSSSDCSKAPILPWCARGSGNWYCRCSW